MNPMLTRHHAANAALEPVPVIEWLSGDELKVREYEVCDV